MNVEQFFLKQADDKFFVVPLVDAQGKVMGNIGDELISRGTRSLLTRLNVSLVDHPEAADWLLFDGGGYLREVYRVLPALLFRLTREFPKKSVCVLPSSFDFPIQSLAAAIGLREAPTVLFARESVSYAFLQSEFAGQKLFSVALDHDMALHLAGDAMVTDRQSAPAKHILIVPRYDTEWTSATRKKGWRRKLETLCRYEQKQFVRWCATQARIRPPAGISLPLLVTDLSVQPGLHLEGFCDVIAQSGAVYTTRMHVAIFASMLGRPTYLFNGSYHKYKGIFDFTLSRYPQTHFMNNPIA